MSLEDVGSTTSLTAESVASDHCDGHSLSQGQEQDQENQCQGQDGIVLERIASLSLDMFDPSDFTGRFTKIQSRSRKRTRIIGGRCRQAWDVIFLFLFFLLEWACQGRNSHWYVTENVNGNLSWPEGLLGLEMVERLVEHLAKVIFHSVTGMQDGFFQSPNQDFEIVSYLLLPVSSCVRTRLAFGLDKCLCCGSCWPCEKWYLLCYEKTTQYYSTNPHSTEWETGMPVWLWPYM